jgi:dTDP-glucose 4,6-dehydratase
LVKKLIKDSNPDAIVHFAAESHVDNSISGPAPFIQTNLVGTYILLENAKEYYLKLEREKAQNFKFIHISTDEVYGSLTKDEKPFSKSTLYAPNSPYSATKAGSDHLARAWFETYGLPVIITNCSNNYGANQHEEKLIPKTIINALKGEDIPIYGKGENIRDWIYVEDHIDGIILALEKGVAGNKYLFGGDNELRNVDLVHRICEILKEKTGTEHKKQIKFVVDRLGHDYRYAINSEDSKKELGYSNKFDFDTAIRKTIDWYIEKHKNKS